MRKIYENKHIIFRKIDLTNISFAISEEDFEERIMLWIIPTGAEFPKYMKKDYQIVKAEELKQKINELFPKK